MYIHYIKISTFYIFWFHIIKIVKQVLDIELSCCLDLASFCLLLLSWNLTTFLGVSAAACNIDLSFFDADALMMAANNASSSTFSERNKGLSSCTTNGFETSRSTVLKNTLFMTSQKLRGFSDELPDTASQMHKYFLQGTAACLSLCYTNHQHSCIHNEPQETVLIYSFFKTFSFSDKLLFIIITFSQELFFYNIYLFRGAVFL